VVLKRLHAATDGRGPRLVLVHGFHQNRNCWGPLAADLARDHEVVRVDLPGHGRSSGVAADAWATADLIVTTGGGATYIGYSMGGRLALHAALAHPSQVRALVVIGATAGIDDSAARRDRVERDELVARRIESEGVERFTSEWLAQPLFSGVPESMRFVEERLTNSAQGLAASLRRVGTGAQDPLWEKVSDIAGPVLVVAGANDDKFAAEGRRLVEAIGARAGLALIPGSGHSPHLERPAATLTVLRAWLDEHG
jgi:2-succinyl-6-hydroxy-2,4-cyclohexadiene-1-carboxylate synthase